MQRVCLFELTAAAAVLAQRASLLIQHIRASGQLHVIDKAASGATDGVVIDPCTMADVMAQRLIAGNLRQLFPALCVRGEEDEDEQNPHHAVVTQAEPAMHALFPELSVPVAQSESFTRWRQFMLQPDAQLPAFARQYPVNSVPIEEIVVWIDPLDGTKEFTEGVLDAVTVLIGISVGGRACAGVIHQPFHAHTVAGIVNVGAWHQTNDQFEQIRVKAMDPAGRVVLTTRSHMSADLQAMLDAIKPTQVIRGGGCGGKALSIIFQRADAYVYPVKGTKKWDTNAPEAIIHALGGCLTDGRGEIITYTAQENVNNVFGLVCSMQPERHASFLPPIELLNKPRGAAL